MTFDVSDPPLDFNETLVFETSNIEPFPLEKIKWNQLIESPKLEEGDFDLIQGAFLDFFQLEESEVDINGKTFNFADFFGKEDNKPAELEFKVVWKDTDDDFKHGNITTLVFWKEEFIGWFSIGGRWLEVISANTVNPSKWRELLNFIYEKTEFKKDINTMSGVDVYDMNNFEVDDLLPIPGIDKKDYS